MDGIIGINKARGMTSHDVVFKLRKILKTKKVGHTGTLDPEVDGVLPICVGKATRISDYVMQSGKRYVAEVTFGIKTSTEDAHGDVIEQININHGDFSEQQVDDVLCDLTGSIKQIPPMYSAVKVKGRKLYEYAREGIEVERPERIVEIYDLKRTSAVRYIDNKCVFNIEVACGKGTYIRTLATQIADKLDTIGHMSDLTRTESGGFKLDECITLDALREVPLEEIDSYFKPIEAGLEHMPHVAVDEPTSVKILFGQKLRQMSPPIEDETVMTYNDKVIAIFIPDEKHPGLIKAKKVFN
ncbi:tRNA pseudouridine(55) synthase TruB [Macrococcus armenti]|uniref:tRNA pseudouridine(55) synthase TruB n=1 Tax=Macrococcus armenti TaxID=2875764 RepID=UPI001CD0026E|nr:tRNA pseudouridine(55) synthase TruB [Macrococcus armenti]UBH09569.1 tRNA pseudouridine(55) synthase TruB [Macrococcus armenti]UBH11845.1 tRNA pseudouridine(55) synthase TruB [Macrococcus armenti]